MGVLYVASGPSYYECLTSLLRKLDLIKSPINCEHTVHKKNKYEAKKGLAINMWRKGLVSSDLLDVIYLPL